MNRKAWRRSAAAVLLGIAGAFACRSKPAPVEEVYSTRMLGASYLQRNQLPQAESTFKRLIELAPDDPLGYANLGLTYLQSGRYDEAEKQLRRARELDPGSADIGLMQAKLALLEGKPADARAILEKLQRDSSNNARVLYAFAELDAQRSDSAALARRAKALQNVLAVAPANLAARLALVDVHVQRNEADSAVRQLEEIRRIPPEPPAEARVYLDSTLRLLRAQKVADARGPLSRLTSVMETTKPYQASREDVRWADGPVPGRPVLTFKPADLITLRGIRTRATIDSVQFTDVTDISGLLETERHDNPNIDAPAAAGAPVALAMGDIDGDGTDDLFVSVWSPEQRKSVIHLFRVRGGFVREATANSGISLPDGATFATFADYDNDGWLDLFAIDGGGRGHLFRNRGNGTFEDVTSKAGIGDVHRARKGVFVDLDHDGDLDLLLIGNGQRTVYRNNLDGTFTDATAAFGLAGAGDARDVEFGDFDGDGRIDVIIAEANGSNALLHNGGAQHFSDVTAGSGLTSSGSGAVAVGDYNNDGYLDLFFPAANGGD
ncbi:MAG TPA: tetratricopeptide repeat protein, partial [Gemmatimonadaceae bacterium]|nr:tetratricopeptide repeat protein [Gemmatimonadaceae bacterium]